MSISNTNDIIFMPHALTLTIIFAMRTKNSPSEISGYETGCCIALGLSERHEVLWSEAFTARIVLSQLRQNKGPKNSIGKFYKTISIFPNGKIFSRLGCQFLLIFPFPVPSKCSCTYNYAFVFVLYYVHI